MRTRLTRATGALVLALALGLVAACNDRGGLTASPVSAPASLSSPGSPPGPGLPAGDSPSAGATDLGLRGDGVDVPGFGALDFGADAQLAREVLNDVLGAGDELAVMGSDCRGLAWSSDGFSAFFHDEQFVGWREEGSPDRTSRTAEGIGVGMSEASLEAIPAAVVLEEESDAGVILGLGSGISVRLQGGRVSDLVAGQGCLFSGQYVITVDVDYREGTSTTVTSTTVTSTTG